MPPPSSLPTHRDRWHQAPIMRCFSKNAFFWTFQATGVTARGGCCRVLSRGAVAQRNGGRLTSSPSRGSAAGNADNEGGIELQSLGGWAASCCEGAAVTVYNCRALAITFYGNRYLNGNLVRYLLAVIIQMKNKASKFGSSENAYRFPVLINTNTK